MAYISVDMLLGFFILFFFYSMKILLALFLLCEFSVIKIQKQRTGMKVHSLAEHLLGKEESGSNAYYSKLYFLTNWPAIKCVCSKYKLCWGEGGTCEQVLHF